MQYSLISFLFLSLVSCGSLATTKGLVAKPIHQTIENIYFANTATDYVYKAKIQANTNNFGGLLIVKKIAKNHHRVVFTTEFGNKIFDFEFINKVFKVNFIMDKLDKKIVINALKKDFQLLVNQYNLAFNEFENISVKIFQTKLNHKDNYYFFKDNKLDKIVMASKRKKKVSILFENTNQNKAKKITFVHHNFNMKINLTYIN